MGYPWGPIGGPKILKIFFDLFLLFPTGIAFRRVKSLEKMIKTLRLIIIIFKNGLVSETALISENPDGEILNLEDPNNSK